jgi:hypothetical protein
VSPTENQENNGAHATTARSAAFSADDLGHIRPTETQPIASAPAKHAPNWLQRKQAEQAINRAQLGLLELK